LRIDEVKQEKFLMLACFDVHRRIERILIFKMDSANRKAEELSIEMPTD